MGWADCERLCFFVNVSKALKVRPVIPGVLFDGSYERGKSEGPCPALREIKCGGGSTVSGRGENR